MKRSILTISIYQEHALQVLQLVGDLEPEQCLLHHPHHLVCGGPQVIKEEADKQLPPTMILDTLQVLNKSEGIQGK